MLGGGRCETHPDRPAVSRDNIRGFRQRRCALCDAAERAQERRELIEAGYLPKVEIIQLSLFEDKAA
jgi:hypothetical protein